MIFFRRPGKNQKSFSGMIFIVVVLICGSCYYQTSTPQPTRLISNDVRSPSPTVKKQPTTESVLAVQAKDKIYIFDDKLRQLSEFSENSQYYYLDNCALLGVTFYNTFIHSTLVDFDGQNISSRTIKFTKPKNTSHLIPSPDANWFAYRVTPTTSGQSLDDSPQQDLEIFNVNAPENIVRITKNSGAWPSRFLWSKDGEHIIFTDFDQNNISQIYLFNVNDSTRINLTNFGQEMLGKLIIQITWSADFSRIVFSLASTQQDQGELTWFDEEIGVISISKGEVHWLDLNTDDRKVYKIWWEDAGILIISKLSKNIELTWMDPLSLGVTTKVSSQMFDGPVQYYNALPTTSDLDNIFMIGKQSFVFSRYNLSQRLLINSSVFTSRYDFITSPSGKVWMNSCSYPGR